MPASRARGRRSGARRRPRSVAGCPCGGREAAHERAHSACSIQGFAAGDRIDLAAIDADTTVAGDRAFTLSSGGTFPGTFANPGELYYDASARILYGNVDADAQADFSVRIAFATGKTGLVEADLVL